MSEKNYYQILGVSRLATTDQIKRRYRYLARIYHPDVADDKDKANRIFAEISVAYQTLVDPNKRAAYDAALDKEFLDYQNRVQEEYRRKSGYKQTSTGYRQTTRNINYAEEAQKKVAEAESAFIAHQFKTAISAAKEAIKYDRNNPKAYVILGDIYRMQGLDEESISMYTVALQLNPRDMNVQSKLDRVARNRMADQYGYVASDRPSAYRIMGIVAGWILILGILMYIRYMPGQPISWLRESLPFISTWSTNLVVCILILGFVIGLMLSLDSKVNPIDEELFFRSIRTTGTQTPSYPIGVVLLIFNAFNFYLASAIYIIIGLMQDCISKSIFTVLCAVAGCAIACEIAYTPSTWQVFLFGGNVIFPGALIGWAIGDMFRSPW